MRADDLVRLRHMRDAALEAIGFMRDKGPSDLEEDRMLQFAVIRAIEIVGEAETHVSDSTINEYLAIPWRSAVGSAALAISSAGRARPTPRA
jgi:uncharacterized protein with HEPN domain